MRVVALWLPVILLVMTLPATGVQARPLAATLTVTDCSSDANFNTALANALPGDTITFNCGGPATIPIQSTKTIDKSITIDANNGGNPVIFSGAAARRVFSITVGSAVGLSNMTIRDGKVTGEYGAGIFNNGNLILSNVIVRDNSSNNGGAGIYSQGALTVVSSNVFSNTFDGIYSRIGSLVVQNSRVTDNIGSGISIKSGNIAISGSTFKANSSNMSVSDGIVNITTSSFSEGKSNGVINFSGKLNISDSLFQNNTSIYTNCAALCNGFGNVGEISVNRSTFANNVNTAGSYGASAILNGNIMTITNSSFYGNTTTGIGTGTIQTQGPLLFINNTISGNTNSGSTDTGAIAQIADATSDMKITNSTIANNTGRGIIVLTGTARIANTIISANSMGSCTGSFTNGGYNLSDTAGCSGFTVADPLLAPLALNGAPTLSRMPAYGSPAVDKIPAGLCPPTDQRGWIRPIPSGGLCDIGSVERPITTYTPLALRGTASGW